MGLLLERYTKHKGSVFSLISQALRTPYSRPVTVRNSHGRGSCC
jgi:hypothetical protein